MNKLVLIFHILFQVALVLGYVSKCVQPGFKCSTCQQLVHCVETPEDFKEIRLNFCNNTENEFCSAESGKCVSDPNVCLIFGLNHINCQTAGSFPDPYDCTAYHICTEIGGTLTSSRYNCPDERAYDSLTATCRFKPDHTVCKTSPVPKCEKPLQTGNLKENPNIFYTCVVGSSSSTLEPRLDKCEAGQVYEENACVEKTFQTLYTCKESGKFIDPQNCYKYFECKDDKTYSYKKCRPGSHFSESERQCVAGPC